jgi:hypothetical protein
MTVLANTWRASSSGSLSPGSPQQRPGLTFGEVGFGRRSFLCDVARKLQHAHSGCATPMLPDGLMVSSKKPSLRDDPKPRCYPVPGLLHGGLCARRCVSSSRRARSLVRWAAVEVEDASKLATTCPRPLLEQDRHRPSVLLGIFKCQISLRSVS